MDAAVALATCRALPRLADDDSLLLDAPRARGVTAEAAVWDDPSIDWGAYRLVIVRSTWDYGARREEFLAWARKVPRILKAAEVIAWNTDKRYRATLPRAVPTQFVALGGAWERPAEEYVVKPAVSAGSIDTARYGPAEHARGRQHVRRLLAAGRTAMVQPYLHAVDEHGESALMSFGGKYSHAIRKGRMLEPRRAPARGLYVGVEIGRRRPTPIERTAAEETLDDLPCPRRELLYARVDLIPGPDGEPCSSSSS